MLHPQDGTISVTDPALLWNTYGFPFFLFFGDDKQRNCTIRLNYDNGFPSTKYTWKTTLSLLLLLRHGALCWYVSYQIHTRAVLYRKAPLFQKLHTFDIMQRNTRGYVFPRNRSMDKRYLINHVQRIIPQITLNTSLYYRNHPGHGSRLVSQIARNLVPNFLDFFTTTRGNRKEEYI